MKTLPAFLVAMFCLTLQAQTFYQFNRWTTNLDTTSINGSNLINVSAANLTGTIADARLSGNVALVTTNAFSLTASNSLPLTTNLIAPTFFLTLNGAGALTNTSGTGWGNIILSNATATATNYFITNATWRAIGSGTTNDAPAGVLSVPSGKVAYVTVQQLYGFTAYWTTVQRTP